MNRRIFLRGSLAASTVSIAVGAGLLSPSQVLAAWPVNAFEAKNVQNAMQDLLGSPLSDPSDKVNIKAPAIAENGAVVPVTVSSNLGTVESISIIAEKNATPLVASFLLAPGTEPDISTRIKMGQTANIIAAVKSGGKVYSARKEVKVTIGGCGG